MNKKRSLKLFKYGTVATVSTAVVLAVAIVLNIGLSVLDAVFDLSYDFSAVQSTEIDKISKDIISGLKMDVEIIVNGSEEEYKKAAYETVTTTAEDGTQQTVLSSKRYTYEIIDSYRKNSEKVNVYYIDSRYNPGFFKERNITLEEDTFITVYAPGTGRYFLIDSEAFEDYQYVGLERRIAAGMANVTREDLKKIAIITGHNEKNFPYLSEMLINNTFEVTSLDLTSVETIPEDISLLVIANPAVSYSAGDILKLRQFLTGSDELGKSLVVFADTDMPENPLLEEFLSTEWGLELGYDAVFDPANSSTVLNLTDPAIKVDYARNEVAKAVAGELYDIKNYQYLTLGKTRNVIRKFNSKDNINTALLLSTFDSGSFGRDYRTNIIESDNFKNITKQTGDTVGPLNVGGISFVQKSDDNDTAYTLHNSNVVLFGFTSILETYYLKNMSGSTQSSAEYIINLFRYLLNDMSTIKILGDELVTGTLSFDSDALVYTVVGISVLAVPIICTVSCIVLWRKRKYL